MPTTTTELGLTKPATTEQYDVNVFNTNMDIVNEHVAGKGGDLASASTISLPATLDGHLIDITGTTGVTAISTEPEGLEVIFQFDGVVTLTHHATSLDLGGSNITTVAGDYLGFLSRGGGNWGLSFFQPAGTHHLTQTLSNKTLSGPTVSGTMASSSATLSGTWTSSSLVFGNGSGLPLTLTTSGVDTGLVVSSTAAGANGPRIELFHNSSSPAGGDLLARYAFTGNDNGGSKTLYGYATMKIITTTSGSEDSEWEFHTALAGGDNISVRITKDGVLMADLAGTGSAAQVDLFDEFDDAPLARSFRLREPEAMEIFEKYGLIEHTPGHAGGWMRNIGAMQDFTLDAIYQLHQRLDKLEARVA